MSELKTLRKLLQKEIELIHEEIECKQKYVSTLEFALNGFEKTGTGNVKRLW